MIWSNSSSIQKLWMVFSQKLHLLRILYQMIYYTFYLKVIHNTIFQMISHPHTQPTQPRPQPFQDIINHQTHKIQQEFQKTQNLKTQKQKVHQQISKQNQSSDLDHSLNQKTLIKQYNKYEPASTKTIREDLENILPEIEDNPQFDFILPAPTELHRVIHSLVAFEQIKPVFVEESKKEKLNMCQNTDNFVTVKKGSLNSCKCIIRMWTNNQGDSNVYQLRCINKESKRLKLILIEGQQPKFSSFCLKIMRRLYNDGLIRLSTKDQIQIFYSENKEGINSIKKEVQKAISKSKKKNLSWESQSFLQQLKAECSRLKTLIRAIPQIQFTLAYQRQFEELCFKQSQIFQLYSQIYKKDYEKFQKRREALLKKWNLFDIFKQLEISEHFEQFRKRRETFRAMGKPFDSLPYMSAVKCLQQISGLSSPGSVLQKVIVFQGKVKSSYNQYFINQLRLSDMDDYLPITIYCVLAMENEDNLLATTKMLLAYLSKEDEFEWEKKILTNLQAAFDYICNEWTEGKQSK